MSRAELRKDGMGCLAGWPESEDSTIQSCSFKVLVLDMMTLPYSEGGQTHSPLSLCWINILLF